MVLTEITDFHAPELDVYARLTEAQLLNRFEPKKGMFIAESPKVIMRALDAGCEPVSLLVERNHINEEAEYEVSEREIEYFQNIVELFHEFLCENELMDERGNLNTDALESVCNAMKKSYGEEGDYE